MIHLYTFIVTTMEMEAHQVLQFYCGRGKEEKWRTSSRKAKAVSFCFYQQFLKGGKCKPPAGSCTGI